MTRSTVPGAGAVALFLGVAGCSDRTMMGPEGMPGSAPMVLSVTPPGDATGVSTATAITIRFSHGMGVGMEQLVDMHEGDVAGPVVPMSCGWSDRTTLTCTPAATLKSRTRCAVHLGAGMMGTNGLLLNLSQMPMGGQWAFPGMMGQHGGMPWNMMGSGWLQRPPSCGGPCAKPDCRSTWRILR